MKKVSVIFSSHLSETENDKFKNHVKNTIGNDVDVEIICIENKAQYSLAEAYNIGWEKLEEMGRDKDFIVFCHNDLQFKTKNWGKILVNHFKNFDYDIIGIAGTTELHKHGCWWLNTKGDAMNSAHMYGRVWHTNGVREYESVYSERINGVQEVVVVDGLFIAVNGSTIAERFDERFTGFHFYDLPFCVNNYMEGCNIGVIDKISVLHKSVGETNQQWEENRKLFTELFKAELPLQTNG